VDGQRLQVGKVGYDIVVVPEGMATMLPSTVRLLDQFAQAGGTVVVHGDPVRSISARPWEQATATAPARAATVARWQHVADHAGLLAAIRKVAPPQLTGPDGAELPEELCIMRRELRNGQVVLIFVNPWAQPVATRVKLPGQSALALDTFTGEAHALPTTAGGHAQIAELNLPPLGHAVWVSGASAAAAAAPVPRAEEEIALRPVALERTSPNVLVLDYCDVDAQGQSYRGLNTIHANEKAWQAQGFPRDLWQWAIQYRRTYIDHPILPGSGFVATYHMAIAADGLEAAMASLELALERPWLYSVAVNGHVVPYADAPRWFDEDMRKASIGRWVQAGANTITLTASPFNMLCELAPIYVLGDFALTAGDVGFTLGAPRPLTLGDWTTQGAPFYPHGVRYRAHFTLERAAAGLRIELPPYAGSALGVRLDEQDAGWILWPPYRLDTTTRVTAGEHTLDVEVLGHLKNMMGPPFNEGLPGPWSWANCPPSPPPGSRYRFYPCGLDALPRVQALRLG
jgi:hypothetical protein